MIDREEPFYFGIFENKGNDVEVKISAPIDCSTDLSRYFCKLQIEGFEKIFATRIYGVEPLHSLFLSIEFAKNYLEERGVEFY